ncbi:MAG: ABC transporter ATP-binding protein [Lachnospiraceae bacterium]|nr:ABC transporter ATP-binding protein [Lachnospiraceae bacterium]
MIKCKNVAKSFDDKAVLKGISFDITEGQIFGLLGPSGAGKTTLIKILTGQLSFDGGEVITLDKEIEKLTGEDKRKIGIMMDQFGVYERLSCSDNLKIYADIYGIQYSKIKEILQYVGLGGAEKRSASKLSKGMEARLRLARVFMHSPKLIFLDEPTSGLDPKSMQAIHKLILDKKKDGCTIFLTTHNMEEAAKLCDKVALLNEGEIVEIGKPSDICLKYNYKKKIILRLTSGEEMELSHDATSAKKIYELMQENTVEAIHSSEPNLETVFLEITGRKLQEEA